MRLRARVRAGRDLVNMAKKRPNVIPIIEDARHPQKYRMLVPMVDVVFADVAQPDQGRIVGLNAQYFLRNGGFFVISIKASCIDSTAPPEAVFAREARTRLSATGCCGVCFSTLNDIKYTVIACEAVRWVVTCTLEGFPHG